jgi:carbonic anhydrase
LERLQSGNARFAQGKSLAINRDLKRIKAIASRQTPFAAFLGCADSRVPVEIIFDQGFGDLFVTRIAGNIASNENIGSLEFASGMLGVKALYVLGHTACGAVMATMQGTEVPGQISGLFQYIRPAVKIAGGDLDKAVRENVRNQAIVLAESSPIISRMLQRQELAIAGGVYDLQTGLVSPVDINLT